MLNSAKLADGEAENMEILDFIPSEEKQDELKKFGMVKNGTIVAIKSLSDVEKILKYSMKTREKLAGKYGNQSGAELKSHIVSLVVSKRCST